MGFFDSITDTANTATTNQAAAVEALVITDETPIHDLLSSVATDPAPTSDLLIIDDTPVTVTVDSVPDMVQAEDELMIIDSTESVASPVLEEDQVIVLSSEPIVHSPTESISYMSSEATPDTTIVSPDETLTRAIAELQASDAHSNRLAEAAHTREINLIADKTAKMVAHEEQMESIKVAHLAEVALIEEQIAAARKEAEDIKTASKRTAYLKELLEAQVTV
jgi:hypothetical protein